MAPRLIRIPILLQDPSALDLEGLPVAEGYDPRREFFNDGPECPRIRVAEDDPRTGQPRPGARYHDRPGKRGWFLDAADEDLDRRIKTAMQSGDRHAIEGVLYSDAFIQVSVFAAALKTMDLFEKKDILGREICWAFENMQLTLVPRYKLRETGARLNAAYIRIKELIVFDYSLAGDVEIPGRGVYACLSRDVVTHEFGHAILDGVNPHVFSAVSPHARAIHESLADLVSLQMAMRSHGLSSYVLDKGFGSIVEATAFSDFAEQLGEIYDRKTLRNFQNEMHLRPGGDPDLRVSPIEPYPLSQVLSGAIYTILVRFHERRKAELSETPAFNFRENPSFSASGQALGEVSHRFRTLLFRAYDALPPGEITLASYGRALLVIDRLLFGEDTPFAVAIRDEFLRRGIFSDPEAARIDDELLAPELDSKQALAILNDDAIAQAFIESNRAWIGIPQEVPFTLIRFSTIAAPAEQDEFIGITSADKSKWGMLRIHWAHVEPQVVTVAGIDEPNRSIKVGTTVILNRSKKQVAARLSCAPASAGLYPTPEILEQRSREFAARQADADAYLNTLGAFQITRKLENALQLIDEDGDLPDFVVEVSGDTIRYEGTGLNLHAGRNG